MQNSVGWFEIYVSDMDRAKTFYENVFQQKTEQLPDPSGQMEMWAFPSDINAYGAPGALVRMDNVEAGNNSVLVYFTCEDCSVEAQRASESGGKVERPRFSIGEYGFIALIRDTEGNMIGLHSQK